MNIFNGLFYFLTALLMHAKLSVISESSDAGFSSL